MQCPTMLFEIVVISEGDSRHSGSARVCDIPTWDLAESDKTQLKRRCLTHYREHQFHVCAQERISLKIQVCVFDVAEDNDIEAVLN